MRRTESQGSEMSWQNWGVYPELVLLGWTLLYRGAGLTRVITLSGQRLLRPTLSYHLLQCLSSWIGQIHRCEEEGQGPSETLQEENFKHFKTYYSILRTQTSRIRMKSCFIWRSPCWVEISGKDLAWDWRKGRCCFDLFRSILVKAQRVHHAQKLPSWWLASAFLNFIVHTLSSFQCCF